MVLCFSRTFSFCEICFSPVNQSIALLALLKDLYKHFFVFSNYSKNSQISF